MADLILQIILNPVYNLPTPLFYTPSQNFQEGGALGLVGGSGVNINISAIKPDIQLNTGVNIDNYNFSYSSEKFSVTPYEDICNSTATDFDLAVANHNMVNEVLQKNKDNQNILSCRATAKASTKYITDSSKRFCGKANKASILFCPLAGLMETSIVNKSVEGFFYLGCKYAVKVVKEETVRIYFEWIKNAENNIKDIELWLSFVNSAEGMLWLSHEVSTH